MTRNPKKVFVGMIMSGSIRWETSVFWEALRFAKVLDYEFVTMRIGGYGQAKARNTLTHMALKTDCGRLVNIDSDMDPTLDLLVRLLSHDVEAVSGMYPKKTLGNLEWVGNFAGTKLRPDGLAEALDFGGGFSCLDLGMIERMVAAYPDTAFESEDPETRGEIIHDLWSNGPVIDDWRGRIFPRYLTEDFYLCWRARKMGVQVWLDTMCQVGHIGSVDFLKLHMKLKDLENSSIFRAPC